MGNKHPELAAAEKLLKGHAQQFYTQFKSKGKLPRDKDWRPFRFAVRDVVIGLTAIRQQFRDNVLEVDVCITADSEEGYVGTKVMTIFLLSEAYKCGSSMGIRFTADFGRKRTHVYPKIYDLALDLGVQLKHAADGYITPKEARHLYLALTGFSLAAERKVMELSLADKASPERCCYMVHHLTWTLPEMESILLGSEWPERIILGNISPQDYQLYLDAILRARAAILGGFLDRKLQLKEIYEGDAVIDLEGNDRRLMIGFDPQFFAKVYETQEDTPIPWTTYSDFVVPSGQRLAVLVRARDWPDLNLHFERDQEAADQLVAKYRDGRTHFFFLAPRDVLELPSEVLENYRARLEKLGVLLMACPEPVSLLDAEAIKRLQESRVMRHDIGTGESRPELVPEPGLSWYNTSEVTWIAVPPHLKLGQLQLDKLATQGAYDGKELVSGVNKANVEKRYHLICDRMQFLAHQAMVSRAKYPMLTVPSHLETLNAIFGLDSQMARSNRLLSVFMPAEQLSQQIAALEQTLSRLSGDTESVQQHLTFLRKAQAAGYTVLSVQDKHAPPNQSTVHVTLTEPTALDVIQKAFNGQFVPDWINDFKGKSFEEIMESLVWRAVRSAQRGQPNGVNFTEIPHAVITNTLWRFAHYEPKDFPGPVRVNIVYSDGSQARPFPLFGLQRRSDMEMEKLRRQPILPIGMISCRHPEMNEMVYHYWFRNMEVSVSGRTNAETDEFCYQRTKQKLGLVRTENSPVRMAFYQTGFQAPLVGFWRAVTEFLIEGQGQAPTLEITPYFYNSRAQNYNQGKIWC